MIVIHFDSLGNQVGVRFDDDVNPPPAESASTLKIDETTNKDIISALRNNPKDLTYVNGIIKVKNVAVDVSPPSQDTVVKQGIKSKVGAKLLDLRNGVAVFDVEMQRALYYILTRLMEKVK